MGFIEVITLPVRLSVAATQATLGMGRLVAPDGPLRRKGGYVDQISVLVGPGGLAEQLSKLIADPHGPVALMQRLAAVTSDDRPLGQAMAPGGALDRVLAEDGVARRLTEPGSAIDRFLGEGGGLDMLVAVGGPLDRLLTRGGALDRVTAEGGPLDRVLSEQGALDRITAQGGVLERLLGAGGLGERLLADDGFVEKLTVDGGTLDQLIGLGDTIERLQESVVMLNAAVEPLSDLVNRIPGSRSRSKRPIRGTEVYTQIENDSSQ